MFEITYLSIYVSFHVSVLMVLNLQFVAAHPSWPFVERQILKYQLQS